MESAIAGHGHESAPGVRGRPKDGRLAAHVRTANRRDRRAAADDDPQRVRQRRHRPSRARRSATPTTLARLPGADRHRPRGVRGRPRPGIADRPDRGIRPDGAEPVPRRPHRRRPGEPRWLVARPVRRRAGRRRGVGPGCGRHVEPHGLDGGRRAPPRRPPGSGPAATSSSWPSPTRSRAATYGARWLADHHADLITTDYALCENGGLHGGPAERAERRHQRRREGGGVAPAHRPGHPGPRVDAVQGRQRAGRRRPPWSPASASTGPRRASTTCGRRSSTPSASTRPPRPGCSIRWRSTSSSAELPRELGAAVPARLHPHHVLAQHRGRARPRPT